MIKLECGKRYLKDVIAFAKRTGQLASLKQNLQYLNGYACHGDPKKTRCRLFTDHAPQSFYFVMQLRQKDGSYRDWFNGGCIYYGPGESGVGDPQFSVRLGNTSKSGWTINT